MFALAINRRRHSQKKPSLPGLRIARALHALTRMTYVIYDTDNRLTPP